MLFAVGRQGPAVSEQVAEEPPAVGCSLGSTPVPCRPWPKLTKLRWFKSAQVDRPWRSQIGEACRVMLKLMTEDKFARFGCDMADVSLANALNLSSKLGLGRLRHGPTLDLFHANTRLQGYALMFRYPFIGLFRGRWFAFWAFPGRSSGSVCRGMNRARECDFPDTADRRNGRAQGR